MSRALASRNSSSVACQFDATADGTGLRVGRRKHRPVGRGQRRARPRERVAVAAAAGEQRRGRAIMKLHREFPCTFISAAFASPHRVRRG
jgi:hypothetical protein